MNNENLLKEIDEILSVPYPDTGIEEDKVVVKVNEKKEKPVASTVPEENVDEIIDEILDKDVEIVPESDGGAMVPAVPLVHNDDDDVDDDDGPVNEDSGLDIGYSLDFLNRIIACGQDEPRYESAMMAYDYISEYYGDKEVHYDHHKKFIDAIKSSDRPDIKELMTPFIEEKDEKISSIVPKLFLMQSQKDSSDGVDN
jgi:hypothetical protein